MQCDYDKETRTVKISGTDVVEYSDVFNKAKHVIIGYGVKEISSGAFEGCTAITGISIPNSVKVIGDSAFSGCKKLVSLYIPKSVKQISHIAFIGCPRLESFEVDEKNNHYSSESGVLYDKKKEMLLRYPPGNKNTSFVIPSTVTLLAPFAFDSCSRLAKIEMIGPIEKMGMFAFEDCKNLKTFSIPESVMFMWTPFGGCNKLRRIEVDKDNRNYYSANGVLFDISMSKLIWYPSNKSNTTYAVPEYVDKIDCSAFKGCTKLTSVELPPTVKEISIEAFMNCTRLKSIFIPDFVEHIGRSAFEGCTALESISLPDSVGTIGDGAFRDCTSLKTIIIRRSKNSVNWNAFDDISEKVTIIPDKGCEDIWRHLPDRFKK